MLTVVGHSVEGLAHRCRGSPAGLFASMSTRRLGATPLRWQDKR